MYTNNTAKTKQRFICSEENCVQHRTPTLATLNTRERDRERRVSWRDEREKQRNAKKQSERNNHIYRVSLLSFSFVVLRSGIMGFITSA